MNQRENSHFIAADAQVLNYDEALKFIKETNSYVIGVLPVVDYSRNPSAIRVALAKRLLQILSWCQKRGIRVSVVLPERDLIFYSGLFNISGTETWCMSKSDQPQQDNLTDRVFPVADDAQALAVYNACSCVFIVEADTSANTDDEEPEESAVADQLETESVTRFGVPRQGEVRFTDEGSPLALMTKFKEKVKRTNSDPYAMFPDYNENLVKRIPLTYFDDMINAKPQHPEPRVLVTGSTRPENPPEDRAGFLKWLEAGQIERGTNVYGNCPECGSMGVMGERCRNPTITCANGHSFNHTKFIKKEK